MTTAARFRPGQEIHLRQSIRKQGGFAIAAPLAITAAIIALIYLSFSAEVTESTKNRQAQLQQEWLQEARTTLTLWYERNQSVIDADPDALTQEAVFAGAGLAAQYGAQFQSTSRMTDGAVFYHAFAVWIPSPDVTGTGFDASGTFQQGTRSGLPATIAYFLVNGRDIELQSLRSVNNQLRKLVQRLEFWFLVQTQSDPQYGAGNNYFRDPACSPSTTARYLPCIDTYTGMDAAALDTVRAQLGFDLNDVRDAWSGVVQFTNREGLPSAPPFAIGLRAITPWGSPIQAFALTD